MFKRNKSIFIAILCKISIKKFFYSHLHYNGDFYSLKSGAKIAFDSLFLIIPAFAGIIIFIPANITSFNFLCFQWVSRAATYLNTLFYGALLFQVFQVYKVATLEMGIKHYMQHGTKVDYSLDGW